MQASTRVHSNPGQAISMPAAADDTLIHKIAPFVFALFLMLALVFAPAQRALHAQGLSAVETAELGVNTLLATALESKALFLSDRDAYFGAIEADLESFVDFPAVARVVMARYASGASAAQTERFADILKSTLTRFYGASLVSYNGEELIFLPNPDPADDPRADTVVSMELRGDINLQLRYQMFINDDDVWKLKNLSLAGINLGRQYYSQFAALMTRHDNDIDAVLDNWK